MIGYLNLPDANLMQPRQDVKAWACLARIQLMVPDYPYLRKAAVEVLHIAFQCRTLCHSARVLRFSSLVTTTHIHYVPTHAVISCCTVGNFPLIHLRILVVINESLHAPVKMYHIRVAHLLPATPTLAYWVGVPVTYLRRVYLTVLGRGSAVDYKKLYSS